jgi:hypothetical protein
MWRHQADHGQKQVTSGRTDRGSLTQGPITEAAVSAGRLLWAISKAAILNQRDRGSARSYPIRRYFGKHGPVFSKEGMAQWQQAETRLLGALTDYTRAAQSTS